MLKIEQREVTVGEITKGYINNEEQGNIIEKRTKGKYNYIYYYAGKWFLQKLNENGEVETVFHTL